MDTSGSTPIELCRTYLMVGLDNEDLMLPVLPKTALEVLAIVNDPNSQLEELSTLILNDQTLVANVLKVANFDDDNLTDTTGDEANSLQEAIARMGMVKLASVAMAVAMQANTVSIAGFEEYLKDSMKESLLSGAWSREIARIMKRQAEGQFLCGLLHTVGKPAVVSAAVHFATENNLQIEFSEIKTLIEEFHIQLGAIITREWELPELIQVATTYYMNYQDAPKYKEETCITYLAHILSHWQMNRDDITEKELRKDEIFEVLEFDEDQVDVLFEKASSVQSVMRSLRVR